MTPSDRTALLAQVEALLGRGEAREAERLCRELTAQAADEPLGWAWLGALTLQDGRLAEAEQVLREAVQIDPRLAMCWSNLAVAVCGQGRLVEGEEYHRRAVELDGLNPAYWANLAACLYSQQRWADAARAYREAVAREARSAELWGNLAAAEQNANRMAEAETAYQRSFSIAPPSRNTLVNYAAFVVQRGLAQQSIPEETEGLLRSILRDQPDSAGSSWLLGTVLQRQGRNAEALAAFRQSLAIESNPQRHSTLLHALQYAENVEPRTLLAEHQRWDEMHGKPLWPASPPAAVDVSGRPLRVGLVSTDFRAHPVAFLSIAALERLDRMQFPIVCYSEQDGDDPYATRFQKLAERWRMTAGLTDAALVELIRQDKIDILIDLMGHSGGRMTLFARRPAAVQITWLGYVGTTGLAAMDFLLADRFHVRPGEEANSIEQVLRMPHGYACYEPFAVAPPVGALPALAAGQVTFGCFGNPAKHTPRLFDAWAEILKRVAGSRLFLKYRGLDQGSMRERLHRELEQRGIDRDRVLLEGATPIFEHMAAYDRVDLALDTQPYSGGVTTCDALWMGVPTITFPGSTFAGRHAVSHLSNAGFEQFIAADFRDYIEMAVDWAGRLDELAKIRTEMRERVRQSPLCYAARFARDLAAVLQLAWATKARIA